jgi:hypothetical protein
MVMKISTMEAEMLKNVKNKFLVLRIDNIHWKKYEIF